MKKWHVYKSTALSSRWYAWNCREDSKSKFGYFTTWREAMDYAIKDLSL